ncbi:ANTAR domain-containing protein [Actinomycetospora rhizophila]|uniref:ANTAR domain-containing protein n=1 Tax=Actinomycetospora rhizophila TaxID=1416876 RepID=A0ABV9ZHA5_9PSEU
MAVTPIREFYGLAAESAVVDPDLAVRSRVAATEAVVRAGYGGFRAVVDTTSLVVTEGQRDRFARFEFLIDQKMAALPISALCAVDHRVIGDAAAELVCLHPLANPGAARFRLYADPAVDAALAGEIDRAGWHAVVRTLERVGPLGLGDVLVIDAVELEFIDHRGLEALDHYARTLDRDVLLHVDRHAVARLADWLDLSRVRVVAPPAPSTPGGPADAAPGQLEQLRDQLEHRERQLESLPDIEQAKGMLMHALDLTDQQAFDTLIRLSQQTNTKLRVVAALLRDELAGSASDHTRRTATEIATALRDRLRAGTDPRGEH